MPQFIQNAHPLNPHLPNMVGEAFTLHQALDINVPIGCGDAPVWAGDVIVGDTEGVVEVPAHLADEAASEPTAMTVFEDFVTEQEMASRSIIGL